MKYLSETCEFPLDESWGVRQQKIELLKAKFESLHGNLDDEEVASWVMASLQESKMERWR